MNFYSAFFRTARWRPKQAIAALYWHVTGRRVRARNRLRISSAQSPNAYQMWIDTIENGENATNPIRADIDRLKSSPKFSVILNLQKADSSEYLENVIASFQRQYYYHWEIIVVGGEFQKTLERLAAEDERVIVVPNVAEDAFEGLRIGVRCASGTYAIPVPSGALFPPWALYHYAKAIQSCPTGAVFYGDEDTINHRGRRTKPWFKPRWNRELFFSQDFITAACAIRIEDLRKHLTLDHNSSEAIFYSLMLSIIEDEISIIHVPHVQCHLGDQFTPPTKEARIASLTRHLAGTGAVARPGRFDSVHVDWPLPSRPILVSIIIPTRNKVELLKPCIDSITRNTSYPSFEIIVVDNNSEEKATLEYLSSLRYDARISILRYSGPFNFSAINNYAVLHSRGEYICLLNNDTEVIANDWLTDLMRQATRQGIGAAGAKLLYPDGTIQHAGVVVGLGQAAGHAHRFLRDCDPGYFEQAHVARFTSAVTAACLVVEKRKFQAVGGLNEYDFQVAFNDVDLCLKLEKAGWRNVYVPRATLVHHESKSRGKDFSEKHIDRYMRELNALQEKWNTKVYSDPLHHPHLDRSSETYLIRL